MYKIIIDSDGTVTRAETNQVIGVIQGFGHTDYFKHPNIVKQYGFKLNTGEHVKISYGGYVEIEDEAGNISKKFVESCHARCPALVRHCFMYGKDFCPHGAKLKDSGFYVL